MPSVFGAAWVLLLWAVDGPWLWCCRLVVCGGRWLKVILGRTLVHLVSCVVVEVCWRVGRLLECLHDKGTHRCSLLDTRQCFW